MDSELVLSRGTEPFQVQEHTAATEESDSFCGTAINKFGYFDGDKKKPVTKIGIIIIGYAFEGHGAMDRSEPLKTDLINIEKTFGIYNCSGYKIIGKSEQDLYSELSNESKLKQKLNVHDGDPDLLIIFVLSHGKEGGYILTDTKDVKGNYEVFHKSAIWSRLKAHDFYKSSLKLYFIGPCRGKESEQKFIPPEKAVPLSESHYNLYLCETDEIDHVIFYSTVEHTKANYNSEGTLLVQAFCSTLKHLEDDTSLEEVYMSVANYIVVRPTSVQSPESVFLPHRPLTIRSLSGSEPQYNRANVTPRGREDFYQWKTYKGDNLGPGKAFIFYDENHEQKANEMEPILGNLGLDIRKRSLDVIESELEKVQKYLEEEGLLVIICLCKLQRTTRGVAIMHNRNISSVIELFTAKNCPLMCGRPKVFIIVDSGFGTEDPRIKKMSPVEIKNLGNNRADTLLFYGKGSVLMDNLMKELQNQDLRKSKSLQSALCRVLNMNKELPCDFPPVMKTSMPRLLDFPHVDPVYKKPIFCTNDAENSETYSSFDDFCRFALSCLRCGDTGQNSSNATSNNISDREDKKETTHKHRNSHKRTQNVPDKDQTDQNSNKGDSNANNVGESPVKKLSRHQQSIDDSSSIEVKPDNSHNDQDASLSYKHSNLAFKNNHIIVLSSDPGTGKTKAAMELAKFLKSNDINVVTMIAKKHEDKFNYDPTMDSLIKSLSEDVSYKQSALIFDGFDEIKPRLEKRAMTFLKDATASFRFVFITARPQEKVKIAKLLVDRQISWLSIKSLTIKEAEAFLRQLVKEEGWQNDWSLILEKIQLPFTPLLLQMLANLIQDTEKRKILNTQQNMFAIYWHFLDSLLQGTEKKGTTKMNKNKSDLMIDMLGAAVKHLIANKSAISIPDKDALIKIGLVTFDEENMNFKHNTWAEFLVCVAMLVPGNENQFLETEDIVHILSDPQHREVRRFLNDALHMEFSDREFEVGNLYSRIQRMKDDVGYTLLETICKEGLFSIYKQIILKHFANLLEGPVKNSEDLLYSACASGTSNLNAGQDIAKDLIDRKVANFEQMLKNCTENHTKLLKEMARCNYTTLLNLLPRDSVSVENLNKALFEATSFNHLHCLEILLDKGADLNARDKDGWTALHFAARKGSMTLIPKLIDELDLNCPANDGKTPFHLAAIHGNTEILKQMHLKNVSMYEPDSKGWNALHYAAFFGCSDAVKWLLSNGFDINSAGNSGTTALHLASQENHIDVVKMLLENTKTDVKAIDHDGWNALHKAASKGNKEIVELLVKRLETNIATLNEATPILLSARNGTLPVYKMLLKNGADINQVNYEGMTVLHYAAIGGNVKIVEELISNGANINLRTYKEWTPLHYAALNGRERVVKLLLSKGAKIEASDCEGWNALHKSAGNGHSKVVNLLVEYMNVNVQTMKGVTALHLAAGKGNQEIFQSLLNKGALVETLHNDGLTTLHDAAAGGNVQIINSLLEIGLDVNAKCKDHWTPLHFAAKKGHFDAFKILISNGALCDAVDNEGWNALHKAVKEGQTKILETLFEFVNVNTCTNDGTSALHLAARIGNYAVFQMILNNGGNVEIIENDGSTTLHNAAIGGNTKIISELLSKCPNRTVKNKEKLTPLHYAAFNGNLEAVQLFIHHNEQGRDNNCTDVHNLDINSTEIDGTTPLHLAAKGGDQRVFQALLKTRGNLDHCDDFGGTLLHNAAIGGNTQILKTLLEMGYDVNARNKKLWTPLHFAFKKGSVENIKLLLSRGAVPGATDNEGWNAFHKAACEGHYQAIKHFINLMDINSQTNRGNTALHLSVKSCVEVVSQVLLKNGAAIDKINDEGCTVLHNAAVGGNVETLKNIISLNLLDVNTRNTKKRTPLHFAAQRGNVKAVKYLLKNGAFKDAVDDEGRSALHKAVVEGHKKVVEELLEAKSSILLTKEGTSPLHLAARNGHLAVFDMLISYGAKVDVVENDGWSTLHNAALGGNIKIFEKLLKLGLDKNGRTKTGGTPMHYAARKGHIEIVKVLIKNGARKDANDNDNWKPYHSALSNGRKEMAELLMESIDVKSKSIKGTTPLHVAAIGGNEELVLLMLKKGADVNDLENNGCSALHNAAISGNVKIIERLIKCGLNPNARSKQGWTPLHYAARGGKVAAVKFLIQNGAKSDPTDVDGWNALHKATHKNRIEVVQLLVKLLDVNAATKRGRTPLHMAARIGSSEIFQLLVQNGASLRSCDKEGSTVLHDASFGGDVNIVQHLVDEGLDVNATCQAGKTPLHGAAENGKFGVLKILQSNGATMDAVDIQGCNALHKAVDNEHKALVEVLVKLVDVNAQTEHGMAPLHLAARAGNNEIFQLLLDQGATTDQVDESNSTTLHFATSGGNIQIVEFLISSGLDVEAKTKAAQTSLHIAAIGGHLCILELLLKNGANVSAIDVNGWSALHKAAYYGRTEVVAALLKYLHVDTPTRKGNSPIHLAAKKKRIEVVKVLLDNGATVFMDDLKLNRYLNLNNARCVVWKNLICYYAGQIIMQNIILPWL